MLSPARVEYLRKQFPALARMHHQKPVIYLDGPAGTQVPLQVANAIRDTLLHHNANRAGKFETSREVDSLMSEAHAKGAAWFGASDPDEVVFGPNMTTLTLQMSRSIAQTWQPGDEILVTRLDHDGNHTPWTLAARDRNVQVRVADIRLDDVTLDLEDFQRQLTKRTRLVAFTAASNSVGTRTRVRELTRMAHDFGAWVYVDAVHYAPHGLIDVHDWDCDFVVCSAYKFFGPHIGMLWGRRELLEELQAYKLRPAPQKIPGKWMTGTQNHACIVGVSHAVDYVAQVDDGDSDALPLRARLKQSFNAIRSYESQLISRLIAGLKTNSKVKIYGITAPERIDERVPTIAFTIDCMSSSAVAEALDRRGIFAWHGNYYALSLSERLGREPEGMLRMGLMHYNTLDEVDQTLAAVAEICGS